MTESALACGRFFELAHDALLKAAYGTTRKKALWPKRGGYQPSQGKSCRCGRFRALSPHCEPGRLCEMMTRRRPKQQLARELYQHGLSLIGRLSAEANQILREQDPMQN